MGVQNLASVNVEPACRCFLFFKEGGSEALSKTEIPKKNKTENFGAPARSCISDWKLRRRNIIQPKISHCAQLRDFFRVVTNLV